MKSILRTAFYMICFLFLPTQLFSQISLPVLFSDNMVLQQKTDAPVWGKAAPNTTVTIVPSWNKKVYRATTDADGHWTTTIETPAAGGPYEIQLTGTNRITLRNVLIGEVWICSGQSNMEMPLAGWGKIADYEKEIAAASYPHIRLLQVEKKTSSYPLEQVTVASGGWQECSPATIPSFSATAYFFGRDLYENLDIPIGLIHTSWGGTLAEAWTSKESLMMMPDFRQSAEEFSQLPREEEKQKAYFSQKVREWNQTADSLDFGMQGEVAIAAKSSFPDHDWEAVTLPGFWENNALPGFDGFVWYRKTIDIPDNWVGNDLTLSLGAIDDNDVTWFNGEKIGTTDGAGIERRYRIPARLVKKGTATITVRVLDTGGAGGFNGSAGIMYVAPENKETLRENLDNEWKYKPALGLNEVGAPPQNRLDSPHNPATLYNAMIAPIVPYAIKGAIWYQGESNAGRSYQYRTLFPLMINDWRTRWGYAFPFYFVQLANFMQSRDEPGESGWAELREAQLQTLRLADTGMAVIIDIGDAADIHPKNKQDVGKRLALQAREKTYGQQITGSGPLYESYLIEKGKIRISFQPNTSKLVAKDGAVKGFAIAGPDKKFHWAEAVIDGNQVVVSSPDVSFPIAVRYAWADNPVCNLFNEAGLPASPFRTDDWAGVTMHNR